MDALTQVLEVEPFDAMIIFVRISPLQWILRNALKARGFAAA